MIKQIARNGMQLLRLGRPRANRRSVLLIVSIIVAAISMATAVAASATHYGVRAWGENGLGELGDGTVEQRLAPVAVSGLTGVTATSAGDFWSLALFENGTVDAWGANEWGQLGDGGFKGPEECSTNNEPHPCSTTPRPVTGLSGVTAIASGEIHNLALLGDGTVRAWGYDGWWQLGDGTEGQTGCSCRPVPITPTGLSGVTAIAAGYEHSLALLSNGTVKAWGRNDFGELGDGTTGGECECSRIPTAIAGLSGVTAIAAGGQHSLALLSNGTVKAWGSNAAGELGDGSTEQRDAPVTVAGLSGVVAIAAGYTDSYALLSNGTVRSWGDGGLLGNGQESESSDVPVAVSELSEVASISAGQGTAVAVLKNGTIMTWGDFLGNGSVDPSDVPVAVSGLSGVTSASSGDGQVLAVAPFAPPTVTGITPSTGAPAGGTSVTITGTNLSEATAVKFGSTAASSYKVNSATSITAVAPAGSGTVDVTVTTPEGTSATGSSDEFTYGTPTVTKLNPTSGPLGGGTPVTISGTNLTGATSVKFGSTNATSFTVNSATSVTATSPSGSGTVDVTVTTGGGTSATGPSDQFSYGTATGPAPTVTKLKPTSGPTGGGTTVTISGTNLTGATSVKFGSTNATSFTLQTIKGVTSISAVAPAESPGKVDVTVTTPGGISATSTKDSFKFLPTVAGVSPSSGSKAGGTSVTITGTGFALGKTATVFKFGTTKATSVNCTSSTTCTVVSPAHAVGTVDVKATVNKVSSAKSAPADQFTYN
jgi:alpha-tubulin suppressor-like RCC1 family protein